MGMVVRTNTMALNAYRQLGMNNNAVTKSLEKLSSGFRINRAGDDAAGLAISEKMKAQITGLETASANAQDGISLIQTAEGNLNEVHSMLNRMVELATKSANGTYTQTERDALQDEVDSLLEEINRISQSANFNGTNLLDGTLGLNTSAFTLGGPTGATDPEPIDLSGLLTASTDTTNDLHLGTASVTEQKPSFTIDLGDFEVNNVTGTGSAVTLTIGSVAIDSVAFTTTQTSGQIATSLAASLNALSGGKGVIINGAHYLATTDGSKIKFEYAGDPAKTTAATSNDAITVTMSSPSNIVSIGLKTPANAATSGSYNHNTIDVNNPVMKTDGERAGITLTLDDTVVKDGNKLTIDGKTFVFKTEAGSSVTAGAGEVLIDVTTPSLNVDLTDSDEVIAAAVDLLSHQATDNFKIEAKSDTQIHIDQLASSTETYGTYQDLVNVFKAEEPGKAAGNKLSIADNSKIVEGNSIKIGNNTYTFGEGTDKVAIGATSADTLANLQKALEEDGVSSEIDADGNLVVYGEEVSGSGLVLQIGDTADDFNKMTVAVKNMGTDGLGLTGLSIETAESSSDAIAKIKTAINTVSTARAGMGALQNRLEHTINNLDVAVENLSAANSRIRDTDMAKEMMNYTKMNVLVQSAQAMLAQANQQPQSVLQLLQ